MRDPDRFAYFSDREPARTAKYVAGGILYALVGAFLVAVVAVARRASDAAPTS